MVISSLSGSKLKPGDELPDGNNVVRYCKPSDFDRTQDEPKLSAFQTRPLEPDLSVNRLDHYPTQPIQHVRDEFRAIKYTLKPNGRFVEFNVGRAVEAVKEAGYNITVEYTPKTLQPSHASIIGLPSEADKKGRLETATALKQLITREHIHNAV